MSHFELYENLTQDHTAISDSLQFERRFAPPLRLSPTHNDLCVAIAPSNHVRRCNLCSLL